MDLFQNHLKAFQWTLMQLSKGKYLLYFIPGLLIGLLYWQVDTYFAELTIQEISDDAAWYSRWYDKSINAGISFSQTLLSQAFIFIVLTVLSPLNTFLSERVEEDLNGRSFGFDLTRFIMEILRMVGVVILALSLEFLFMGIWGILSWVFGLDFFDSIMYFILASFFYGFSFYDYSLERHSIGIGSSLKFAKNNWLNTLMTGAIFTVMIAIPIFGIPIASVLVTIISTHVFLKMNDALELK
jgi:CysZ protein